MDILRTDTENYGLAVISAFDQSLCLSSRNCDVSISHLCCNSLTIDSDLSIHEVHLWRSDKSCNEQVLWLIV